MPDKIIGNYQGHPITLFYDAYPAADEYVGDVIGLMCGEYAVLGLLYIPAVHQYGVVLFNHAAGVWLEEAEEE